MKKIILLAIIVLAFILRFYRLDNYPAFNADEAAIGYNAYSLLETGKDEHGNSWPIHFQSFNDYKPGFYFYMVMPFVKILGLNEWAVRVPNATLGVLTVVIIYFLVKELFKNNNLSFSIEHLALSASFFLAISPWHIQFSRGGWEVNVASFFIASGILFFLKGMKNPKLLVVSCLSLVASLYTYHAARVVVPLLGLGLTILHRAEIKKNLKYILLAGLISLVFLTPLLVDLSKGSVASRATGVGLFADPGPLNRINEQRGEHENFNSLAVKVLHNKAVNYGLAFIQNWTAHFHGEFLFLSGDNIQRDKVPETGEMYLFDILFLGVALIVIARKPQGWGAVIFWLIVASTAAALTFQSPHALRAENMVIPLVIISAYGLCAIIGWLEVQKVEWIKIGGFLAIGVLLIWSFARYEHLYWSHMAKEYPFSSQYGVKELAFYVKENQDKFSKVWVTDRYDQPYILFLFYMKYPPEKFQGNHILTPRDQFGFSTVRDFDKYHFETVNFDKVKPENPNSMIVGTPKEIPKEANIVKKIYGSNGFQYFRVIAN